MHDSSREEMQANLLRYLGERVLEPLAVLDVGSMDINGSYRELMPPSWTYTGVDIAEGANVDAVMPGEFMLPFGNAEFDLVLCGQVLEHCRDPHRLTREMARMVKPGGWLFLTAPAEWPRHRFPLDCWRIHEDGMRALIVLARLSDVACYERPGSCGIDTWGIARRVV